MQDFILWKLNVSEFSGQYFSQRFGQITALKKEWNRMRHIDTRLVLMFIAAVLLTGIVAVFLLRHGNVQTNNERVASKDKITTVKLRLQWFPQAQFAGYYVAKERGYYAEEKINVEIRPTGPDLRPTQTVAQGADDIGIGVSNQVITAVHNGVDLTIIAQIFQDSANRYVLRSENKIASLSELKGKKVGLWMAGDEAEFIAMLASQNLPADFVTIIPQGDNSVGQFLQNDFVLSQVTTYNELGQIADRTGGKDRLQIISPADYGAAIPGDMIFTTKRYLAENEKLISRFLYASLRGWETALANPEETVKILVRINPELNRQEQLRQLNEVGHLIKSGLSETAGIGAMDSRAYAEAQKVMLISRQIEKEQDPATFFSPKSWEDASKRMKKK